MTSTTPPRQQPTYKASFIDIGLNNFQIWALQHPENIFSKVLLPIIIFIEGLAANLPTYLDQKRLVLGPNFCCAGQVVMGEFEAIETALTSPQARTWRLGTTVLEANHLPNQDVDGRNVFLLALSDQEATGSNDHEAFRRCLQDYILNDSSIARQQDAIARQLIEKLAADYIDMSHGPGGAFFSEDKRGWKRFLIEYLHYVLFQLDPNDQATMDFLTDLHYTRQGTLRYFAGVSTILEELNIFRHGKISESIEQAATIYENSPVLANFNEQSDQYNGMTRRELAKLMTSIMSIAALQGPLHLGQTAMGDRPLPAYKGQNTSEINPTHYWDELDLDNRESVRLYLLECSRLWAPVSASHKIATDAFTVTIAGRYRTFPTGTKILIPMSLGLLDENFWGPTTYQFDANRENLCPYHMGFHSVGDRSAGRICPGKDVAMNMLVDVTIALGKVRRSTFSSNINPV
ncbi:MULTISPECIES: cytochrome 450 [unclassified Okeania]|uniref:cytochrome 450 n=3 Tax=Microcoleaceae TaxID=1892252 RepID=UPI0013BA92EE|nr:MULTISPECIES: cytochrome 450 [unclassified Okeania]NET12178.1 cytochrome P450 [Okeania sp. SIO1H6]NES76995.1 cytochrome P450 [Okeania sp. SIO1H4]NET20578.1 cytochrome P450 [Okeania sp. SIO1H5]NET79271.1 cytochrome P450 [Okeania sp. SIO1F9]NET96937.1 cytochrome P450 [Okeania sp. SIO1H2]